MDVYYRVSENIKRNAPWSPEYLNGVSEAMCSEKMRFVGGVFECPSQQAEELGRGCCAMAPNPFAQVSTEKFLMKTIYAFDPLCVCVIVGTNCRPTPLEDQPTMPLWPQDNRQKRASNPLDPIAPTPLINSQGQNRVSLAETRARRRRPRISLPRRR